MKWVLDQKLYRESTKTANLKKAKKIAQKKEEEILQQKGIVGADKITLKDMIEEVLFDYRANGRKSTYVVELRSKTLYDFFGKETKIVHITEDAIHKYITHRLTKCKSNRDEPLKPATINRELMLLKRGFSLMVERHKLGLAPTIKMLKEDNVRKGFLEHWQFMKLLEQASDYIKPVIRFLYYTGWRTEEALTLTWDMVDVDNGIISLSPGTTKNKKGRHYYMPNEILEMIRTLWAAYTEKVRKEIPTPKYVFTNRDCTDRIKDMRGAWKNSCKKAGLDGKLMHDFRRTAARNYVRAGVPQRVAQELLGHQTSSIFSRYNIVSDQDLREGAKKVSAYLNNQSLDKPIENPPEGFRLWEPSVKKYLDETERVKQEWREQQLEEHGAVVQIGEDDKVRILEKGKDPK
jgi:integrase